ncbi:MAG: efflux RND transporter periplasmic adaptor subunit [Acidobacteria bacterium]|nr:efflux RND transporter periplasmic adaptor subunit [Acidobacteriota bacterium]
MNIQYMPAKCIMKSFYCQYPPGLDKEVEVTPQTEAERTVYVVGRPSTGRYIKLGQTEYQVLQLLGGRTLAEISAGYGQQYGGNLSLTTLIKFLSKLNQLNLLAGEGESAQKSTQSLSRHAYFRLRLFDPDPLFSRIVPKLRWIWTTGFVVVTAFLMLIAVLVALGNSPEIASHSTRLISEHYWLILFAGLLVVFSHEFAHGLTCKAFGGRATEVGVLLIYYFIPALYCNVSGLHAIPQRSRRLWVIAAGVYWQLLVGTISLLAWFLLEPYTLFADTALLFCLGSLLNIAFNANPLIKLDGYYFLTQLLYLPNLMEKSRTSWRGLLRRLSFGGGDPVRLPPKQRLAYFIFGPLSLGYTIVFLSAILLYLHEYFVDNLYAAGFGGTGIVAAVLMRQQISKGAEAISTALFKRDTKTAPPTEPDAPAKVQPLKPAPQSGEKLATPPKWKRRVFFAVLALIVVTILLTPWDATVPGYGTLTPLNEKEAIITAPEGGIATILVKPGDAVESGKELARLHNPDLNSDLIALRADIVKTETEYERLLGDIKVKQQDTERAAVQLNETSRLDRELREEQQRILSRRLGGQQKEVDYPAALAVLQSDIDLKKSRLDEAETQLNRSRQLFRENLIPKSDLEGAEAKVTALRHEVDAARERLQSALVEHRRQVERSGGNVRVNQTELQAAQSAVAKTTTELESTRKLLETLRQKEQVLFAKQNSVLLTAPRNGVIFGEKLLELNGKYLEKGAELCRIADPSQLRVRIQVPEREIGDVKEGAPVRLKTRAWPDRIFEGRVEKIGGEAEPDENKQMTYRVELIVDNKDGALKPGMTAFARITFGRRAIGWILWHKVKQALRPELWLF